MSTPNSPRWAKGMRTPAGKRLDEAAKILKLLADAPVQVIPVIGRKRSGKLTRFLLAFTTITRTWLTSFGKKR